MTRDPLLLSALSLVALALVAAGCSRPPAAGPGGPSGPGAEPVPVRQPDAGGGAAAQAADGPETLAFEIVEGAIANHFFRRGPVSAHLLASSGTAPRLIVAFPAGNEGIGLWFEPLPVATRLAVDGPLAAVERADGLRGVAATLVSDAASLRTRGAVLGSVRTLRDYAALGAVPAETRHVTEGGPLVVLRRATVGGRHRLELTLEPRDGTLATVADGQVVLTAAPGRPIRVVATALQDDPPLTPIGLGELLVSTAGADPKDLRALAFLAYSEKLLAGSWRFLTYFGRDTLLSVRLLLPALRPAVIEAALGSVIDRLGPDGDVAHEEDIGDFAALRHARGEPPPGDPAAPLFDYKMVDDDFLLLPVLAAYLLDTPAGRERAEAFLARRTPAGEPYRDAVLRNLRLVAARAEPYATTREARDLVAIRPDLPVGEWRDSEEGLGRGRYPYDVNVALVPAALAAGGRLLASPALGVDAERAARLRRLADAWQGTAAHFRVEVRGRAARDRIRAHARAEGIDPAPALAAVKGDVVFSALALDAAGRPLPVMHTDDGFALLFGEPPAAFLEETAGRILRPFPAGLRTPVGVVVANPAFAADARLRALFTRGHYHGAVVWSWQQALLAAGLRRQLGRAELPAPTRAVLARAERALWDVIRATDAARTGELWSWAPAEGAIVLQPFGQGAGHADESNAVQLWSTVYLAVRPPAEAAPAEAAPAEAAPAEALPAATVTPAPAAAAGAR